MQYIGERISVKSLDNGDLSIVILAVRNKWKNIALFLWFFAWSVSGMIVFTQYFTLTDEKSKVILMVWMGFWVYFEYKIFKAMMWRNFGVEKIKVRNNQFQYKREVAGKGKVKSYDLDFIKDWKVIESKSDSFSENINNSYWVIGNEKIRFDYYGKEIKFALQITEKDAEELIKVFKKNMK
jgi:hypothetical protein